MPARLRHGPQRTSVVPEHAIGGQRDLRGPRRVGEEVAPRAHRPCGAFARASVAARPAGGARRRDAARRRGRGASRVAHRARRRVRRRRACTAAGAGVVAEVLILHTSDEQRAERDEDERTHDVLHLGRGLMRGRCSRLGAAVDFHHGIGPSAASSAGRAMLRGKERLKRAARAWASSCRPVWSSA